MKAIKPPGTVYFICPISQDRPSVKIRTVMKVEWMSGCEEPTYFYQNPFVKDREDLQEEESEIFWSLQDAKKFLTEREEARHHRNLQTINDFTTDEPDK